MAHRQVREFGARTSLDRAGCLAALLVPLACLAVVWAVTPGRPKVPVAWSGYGDRVDVALPGLHGPEVRYVVGPDGRAVTTSTLYRHGDRLLAVVGDRLGIIGADGQTTWRAAPTAVGGAGSVFPLAQGVVYNEWRSDQVVFVREGREWKVPNASRVEPDPDSDRWAVARPNGDIEVCRGPLSEPIERRLVHRLERPRHWCFDWRRGEVVWSAGLDVWSASSPGAGATLRYHAANGPMAIAIDRRSGDLLVLMDAVLYGWMVSVRPGQTRPRWRQRCHRFGSPIGELNPADLRLIRSSSFQVLTRR